MRFGANWYEKETGEGVEERVVAVSSWEVMYV